MMACSIDGDHFVCLPPSLSFSMIINKLQWWENTGKLDVGCCLVRQTASETKNQKKKKKKIKNERKVWRDKPLINDT